MSTNAHTPGPWTVQPIGDETEANILGAGRELIATVSDNDARLIAAAPEMLEALEAVMGGQIGGNPDMDAERFQKARAAIAKARGESK